MNSGFLYIHKRDLRHHNILVVDCGKTKGMKDEDLKNMSFAANFLMTYMIAHLSVPGKAEAWTMILDLKDIGMTDLPLGTLKGVMASAQNNFRGTAFKIFILNANLTIRAGFSVIKLMLDDFTNNKINMLDKKEIKQSLLKFVAADCLEQRFGGTVPDKVSGFFPPD